MQPRHLYSHLPSWLLETLRTPHSQGDLVGNWGIRGDFSPLSSGRTSNKTEAAASLVSVS